MLFQACRKTNDWAHNRKYKKVTRSVHPYVNMTHKIFSIWSGGNRAQRDVSCMSTNHCRGWPLSVAINHNHSYLNDLRISWWRNPNSLLIQDHPECEVCGYAEPIKSAEQDMACCHQSWGLDAAKRCCSPSTGQSADYFSLTYHHKVPHMSKYTWLWMHRCCHKYDLVLSENLHCFNLHATYECYLIILMFIQAKSLTQIFKFDSKECF